LEKFVFLVYGHIYLYFVDLGRLQIIVIGYIALGVSWCLKLSCIAVSAQFYFLTLHAYSERLIFLHIVATFYNPSEGITRKNYECMIQHSLLKITFYVLLDYICFTMTRYITTNLQPCNL